jgi:hypothetical protein
MSNFRLCIACAIVAGTVGASIGVLATLGTIAWFVLDWGP